MRYKIYALILFLFSLYNVSSAGPSFGFGIGYIAKNTYTDIIGFEEKESGFLSWDSDSAILLM
ncbi:hypothetical protein KAW96_03390 [candidate division WOR-3 bacterium]|nr:hypothetical protein [candidate division WOR-3 bacterium]